MTPLACDAAAIELEAYATELLATAAILRRFAQRLAGAPTGPAAAVASPAPGGPASPARPVTTGDTVEARILACLRGVEPQPRRAIEAAVGGNTVRTRNVLRALVEAKRVTARGQTNQRRYSVPSRPEPGAGTQAGSACGSGSGGTADEDVVWSGALERAGRAPALLPPREHKR